MSHRKLHVRRTELGREIALGIELHKEWCKQNFVAESLEIDLVFRATIKPAYQRRISIHLDRTLVYVVVSLRKGRSEPGAEFSSKQRFSPLACAGDAGYLFAIAITIAVLLCRVSLAILK